MTINILLIISTILVFLTTIHYLEENSIRTIGIHQTNKVLFHHYVIIMIIIALILIYTSNPLINKFVNKSYASLCIKNCFYPLYS